MDGHKTEKCELVSKCWEISHVADNERNEDISEVVTHHEDEFEYSCSSSVTIDSNRIKSLEQEQENLTSSLIALTSHFAHVQFRLRQIVAAPPCNRELLIKSLEDFASRGIPEANNNMVLSKCGDLVYNLDQTYRHQFDLIERLKDHLIQLENGSNKCFSSNIQNGHSPSSCNQTRIDLSGPPKIREKWATTIKSQISDLEQLVALFYCGSEETNLQNTEMEAEINEIDEHIEEEKSNERCNDELERNSNKELFKNKIPIGTTLGQRLNRMAYMAMSSLGLYVNILARKFGVNKWNYLQKELKESIQETISLVLTLKRDIINKPGESANSDEVSWLVKKSFCLTNVELVSVIRGKFAPALQKLIQHGLHRNLSTTTTPTPTQKYFEDNLYACSSDKNIFNESNTTEQLHAWELIMEYCSIADTDEFIKTAKINDSKISLLNALEYIRAIHAPYKRNYNSHFKSFISAGLNSHQLAQWLELIFRCKNLVQTHYTTWSYVVRTGFRDALILIDQLMSYDFDIPINISIR